MRHRDQFYGYFSNLEEGGWLRQGDGSGHGEKLLDKNVF